MAYETLIGRGFAPEQPLLRRSNMSVSENGKKYVLNMIPPKHSACFQIDGDIVKTGIKCDKLVLVDLSASAGEGWAEIFVELKGRDISHGIDQLDAVLRNGALNLPHVTKRRARIITNSCIASAAKGKLQMAKVRFLKDYKCDLRVLRTHSPETI